MVWVFYKRKSIVSSGNGTPDHAVHILLVIIHTTLFPLLWEIIASQKVTACDIWGSHSHADNSECLLRIVDWQMFADVSKERNDFFVWVKQFEISSRVLTVSHNINPYLCHTSRFTVAATIPRIIITTEMKELLRNVWLTKIHGAIS